MLACAVIWGSFAATLAAALAYPRPGDSGARLSWLTAFDFKAPFTLYLDPLVPVRSA